MDDNWNCFEFCPIFKLKIGQNSYGLLGNTNSVEPVAIPSAQPELLFAECF